MRSILSFAVDDHLLRRTLVEDSDRSVRDYVRDVISPYFNVPSNLAGSEGQWEAFVHISSDNINEFARNVVYQRRKSMKSAVELAFHEMKNNKRSSCLLEDGNGDGDSSKELANKNNKSSTSNVVVTENNNTRIDQLERELVSTKLEYALQLKDKQINQLEQELASTKLKHASLISSIEDQHAAETKDNATKYTDFVAKLLKSHRGEMEEQRNSQKRMQDVHKTFLESYVEASVDALRNNCESPSSL